jgi:hypothetical protein
MRFYPAAENRVSKLQHDNLSGLKSFAVRAPGRLFPACARIEREYVKALSSFVFEQCLTPGSLQSVKPVS